MPKSKKQKKLSLTKTRFNRTGILVTVLLFGFLGILWLLHSFAATTGKIVVNKPAVAIIYAGSNSKYWMATSDGGVFSMGGAPFYGSMGGKALNQPITSFIARPQLDGYWLLGGDGGVFSFGKAVYHGRPPAQGAGYYRAIVSTPSGNGYWIVSKLGQILEYGDATTYGAAASSGWPSINASRTKYNTAYGCCLVGLPAGGITAAGRTSTGRGLFLLSDTDHTYDYGDAKYSGWTLLVGGDHANAIAAYGAGSTSGYLVATAKGYVYKFGAAPSYGDMHTHQLAGPIISIAYTSGAKGYWLAGQDGGVFAFGDAVFKQALQAPITAPAPTPTPTPAPTNTTTSTPTPSKTTTTSGGSTITCAPTQVCDLQKVLGVTVDGQFGPQTEFACKASMSKLSLANQNLCKFFIAEFFPPTSNGGTSTSPGHLTQPIIPGTVSLDAITKTCTAMGITYNQELWIRNQLAKLKNVPIFLETSSRSSDINSLKTYDNYMVSDLDTEESIVGSAWVKNSNIEGCSLYADSASELKTHVTQFSNTAWDFDYNAGQFAAAAKRIYGF